MSTHLVKHQKLTKRHMKEDALVTAAFKATEVWERHGRVILAVAGGAVLVAVLAIFVMRTRAQSEARAQGDLFRAVLAMQQNDYVTGGPMLKELVDNSSGTRAAREALRYRRTRDGGGWRPLKRTGSRSRTPRPPTARSRRSRPPTTSAAARFSRRRAATFARVRTTRRSPPTRP